MILSKMADKVVEADVLIVGGGISGVPAAIKAAEHGLNVTLLEKAKVDRAGSTSCGLDEIGWYPNGISTLDTVKLVAASGILGQGEDPNPFYRLVDNMFWALEELEKVGVNMKYHDGKYRWIPGLASEKTGGEFTEGVNTMLLTHWVNVKPDLAATLRKTKVNVLNRTMMVDLLTNKGGVVGATAIDTRTGEFIVVKAKAVILATSMVRRNYNNGQSGTFKYRMRYHVCPSAVSGDGHAAAYRAGADIVKAEAILSNEHIDHLTLSCGNFTFNDGIPSKTFTWNGKEISHLPTALEYRELEQRGLTPLYESFEDMPDDFHKRLEVHYISELAVGLMLAEKRGFNPRTHRYAMTGEVDFGSTGRVLIGEDFMTPRLKGLFAIGDVAGYGGGGYSSCAGFLLGDSIHKYVSEAGEPVVDEAQVESQKQIALAPLYVKDGTEPMELECTIRQYSEKYAGLLQSEGKLREGRRRLGSLRREFLPKLMAKNPHYLMRCLEVRNILDVAEIHFNACLELKETRGVHFRLDYPERDPLLDKKDFCQRIENGKLVTELRDIPDLKPEYSREGK